MENEKFYISKHSWKTWEILSSRQKDKYKSKQYIQKQEQGQVN